MNEFRKRYNDIPVVWCGDFNSQPRGYVHRYLTEGVVNAKSAAPWYTQSLKENEVRYSIELDLTNTGQSDLTDQFERLHMSKRKVKEQTIACNGSDPINVSDPKVKYLLDFTLNRFCRWLRILGLDAALETEKEEKERTKDAKM